MNQSQDHIRNALRCYVILNVGSLGRDGVMDVARQVLASGATMVQLRDKWGKDVDVVALAQRLAPLCQAASVPLLLNDRWQLVKDCGADGVHLGAEDGDINSVRSALGEQAIIGRSIDRPEDCETGHDYFGLGPIFNTTDTKQDTGPVVGLAQLRGWRERIPGPLVAIGGMSVERAPAVIQAGADGVAVVSAICDAIHPDRACANLRQAVDHGLRGHSAN